jgi:hypothetical protein
MLLQFLDTSVCVLLQSGSDTNYDRTTSKWGDLSPKIMSGGFSTKRKYTNITQQAYNTIIMKLN